MTNDSRETFESLKARLDEIVEAVADDNLPLDDALTLYEEAVSLGLRASDLLEENMADESPETEEAEQTMADAQQDADEVKQTSASDDGQETDFANEGE